MQNYYIELFQLSPHFTHLIQPLDIGYFLPYKYYYTEVMDDTILSGSGDFIKLEFLANFQFMHTQIFQ